MMFALRGGFIIEILRNKTYYCEGGKKNIKGMVSDTGREQAVRGRKRVTVPLRGTISETAKVSDKGGGVSSWEYNSEGPETKSVSDHKQ